MSATRTGGTEPDTLIHTMAMEEDINKKKIPKKDSFLSASEGSIQGCAPEVVGLNVGAGTEITAAVPIVVPAGQVLYLTKIHVSSNLPAVILIGTGTAYPPAAPIDHKWLPGAAGGSQAELTDGLFPLLVIDNSAGAVALNVYIYAPHTAMGVTPNDSAGHYFYASWKGVLV